MYAGTRDVSLGKSPAILSLSQASNISWEGRSPGCFLSSMLFLRRDQSWTGYL